MTGIWILMSTVWRFTVCVCFGHVRSWLQLLSGPRCPESKHNSSAVQLVSWSLYKFIQIATSYRLGGQGSNPVRGEIFRTRLDRPWDPLSFLSGGYRFFPGEKAVGAWHWPPTPSSVEVKERVELYLCSTYGPSRRVIWWNLSLALRFNSYGAESWRQTDRQ